MNLLELLSPVKGLAEHAGYTVILDSLKAAIRNLVGNDKEAENLYRECKIAAVFLQHRRTVSDRFYEKAFEAGGNVLYVSIMSKDTLDEMEGRLDKARHSATSIRVLTWDAGVGGQVVEAFRRHLGEYKTNPKGAFSQVKDASAEWNRLRERYPDVIVDLRRYSSVPTMQGILVKGAWVLVELMPYHTTKDMRPALFLTPKLDPELYPIFAGAFEGLYIDSKPF